MTNELTALFDYFEKEKGMSREKVIDAVSKALLSAAKKRLGPLREMRVDIEPNKGDMRVFTKPLVVEEVTNKWEHLPLKVAQRIKPGAQIGEEVDIDVTPKDFGRIAAQTAKQAMMQSLRQAEKEMIYDEFKDRAGDIVSGVVRRFEKSDVVIDLGKFEGLMPAKERVATEDYNIGDRIRAYVVAVENGARGPEIILSRSHPNFVKRLFESEVTEIADHTVQIRGIAREAGYRTKVAVFSGDDKVDPVGACVGLKGARVKNIVRELNNEKVDIIRWSDEPKDFVKEALKPAQINDSKILIDAERRRITVRVQEEELSKAIGRRGQNARLTSRLLGWDVQVEKDESAHEQFEGKVSSVAQDMAQKLGVSEEVADKLVREGMNSIEIIATGVDASDIAGALGLDESAAAVIVTKAQEVYEREAAPPVAENA
ncbi:MAG: transcription termination factor NusA [Verrucomicrobiales bacterium]